MILFENLYTWVDISNVLFKAREQKNNIPNELIWASPYWDELLIGTEEGGIVSIDNWLKNIFGSRFINEDDTRFLILDGTGEDRRLLIEYEEIPEQELNHLPEKEFRPSFGKGSSIWFKWRDTNINQPTQQKHNAEIIAFYSVKGGVGRTTSAMSLALELANKFKNNKTNEKVLIVDADFEAPGISVLFKSKKPSPSISFADLLALVHSEDKAFPDEAIALTSTALKEHQIDNVFVLPCFRETGHCSSLEIRPEDIGKSKTRSPFIISEVLRKIADTLGCKYVVVDLRAGFTELSAPFLMDPSIHRVFVTTPSGQAFEASKEIAQYIGTQMREFNVLDKASIPAIIMSQVPYSYSTLPQYATQVEALRTTLLDSLEIETEEDTEQTIPVVTQIHHEALLTMAVNWDEYSRTLENFNFGRNLLTPLSIWLEDITNSNIDNSENTIAEPASTELNIEKARSKLSEYAENMIFGEQSELPILSIEPLSNLVDDFRQKLPVVAIVGAKGAGKTFTYKKLITSETWEGFSKLISEVPSEVKAKVVPILAPQTMEIDGQPTFNQTELKTYIREAEESNKTDADWVQTWLNTIALRHGISSDKPEKWKELLASLNSKNTKIVAVFDGLEELFVDFSNNTKQQTAIRTLIVDVPQYLKSELGRPVGLVAFVRQDLVEASIPQNLGQVMDAYRPYALKWSRSEVLELAAWVSKQANIFSEPIWNENFKKLSEEEQIKLLYPLWGTKLGSKTSKEAFSAEWVLAFLSDLKIRLLARDFMRFLHYSAAESNNKEGYRDRVLHPTAIKRSIEKIGKVKVEELSQENRKLGNIFKKLKNSDDFTIPANEDEVKDKLTPDEVRLLENEGVVLQVDDLLQMPEIFRLGLNLTRKKGHRPNSIGLIRRVRSRV
ncbi:AAA family ATPase [Terasakiella sp. A23]|uniref:KGGVGR-motif variant AAA ATPase n=1 Tax=Terasakiella sp. FCG-A23 TaxID=3080561 RepID=UPI00295534C0|nr:AAA family ATPase [Terasakiella sp. A23]MDV7340850.1 AAA family ATPase [Terasakiella sp. A23]